MNSSGCIRVGPPVRILSVVILLAWLGAGSARADCEREGAKLFPAPHSVVPTNVRFLLEGIGKDQERVSKLVGRTLVMTSGEDKVSVQVRPGYRSEAGRVTVWLVPSVELSPGRQWGLGLMDALEGVELLNWGGSDVLYPQWRVADRADSKPPAFKSPPAASTAFNRGGARGVKFRFVLQEESPTFLLATLRRAKGSAAIQRYPVMVNASEVVLGHDACSGGFTWDEGRAYRVLFEAVDSAGNRSLLTDPIEFQAPLPVKK